MATSNHQYRIIAACAAVLAATPAAQAQQFSLTSAFTISTGARTGSSEILAFTPSDNFTVLSTASYTDPGVGSPLTVHGVQILSLGANGSLTEKGFADFSTTFGLATDTYSLSSVAADPLGRGFGVASIIPQDSTGVAGRIAFFDYRGSTANAARSLVLLDVGFHPDSVTFSADGTKLFVANEGEYLNGTSAVDAPGSISVIDLSSISTIANVGALTNANVATYDFSAANLGAGASLAGIRNPSIAAVGTTGGLIAAVPNFTTLGGVGVGSDPDFHKGIEPEYITQKGSKLYVTLQENNAIGVFDLTSQKWEKIHKLGTITQTLDGSDVDDPDGAGPLLRSANIDDVVKGLPMPDTIASYTIAGTNYLVTANEGDARHEDRADTVSSRDLTRWSASGMTSLLDPSLASDPTRDNATGFGRLNISRLDGDNNNDGLIDEAVAYGTRSFSIWNADTGALVWDSGSGNSLAGDSSVNALTNLETLLLGLDPALFNMNSGNPSNFDTRSDDKGPEPEALTIGELDGRTYAFLGMERQNGLMMFDITDPNAPVFVSYINSLADGLISPESMTFISAADSPTGHALVLTGYESADGMNGAIGVYTVPEPSTAVLLLTAAAGVIGFRRRRA